MSPVANATYPSGTSVYWSVYWLARESLRIASNLGFADSVTAFVDSSHCTERFSRTPKNHITVTFTSAELGLTSKEIHAILVRRVRAQMPFAHLQAEAFYGARP